MLSSQALLPFLNHLLAESGWATARLAPHAGRVTRVDLPLFGALIFAIGDDGCLLPAADAATADLTLSLPADALLQFGGDRERLIGRARMHGNVEFAETLGFVLRNLRWDVEEDLSRVTGDIAARRLLALTRAVGAGTREAIGRLGSGIAEASALPGGAEWPGRIAEIRSLAERVDALAERIATAERSTR